MKKIVLMADESSGVTKEMLQALLNSNGMNIEVVGIDEANSNDRILEVESKEQQLRDNTKKLLEGASNHHTLQRKRLNDILKSGHEPFWVSKKDTCFNKKHLSKPGISFT